MGAQIGRGAFYRWASVDVTIFSFLPNGPAPRQATVIPSCWQSTGRVLGSPNRLWRRQGARAVRFRDRVVVSALAAGGVAAVLRLIDEEPGKGVTSRILPCSRCSRSSSGTASPASSWDGSITRDLQTRPPAPARGVRGDLHHQLAGRATGHVRDDARGRAREPVSPHHVSARRHPRPRFREIAKRHGASGSGSLTCRARKQERSTPRCSRAMRSSSSCSIPITSPSRDSSIASSATSTMTTVGFVQVAQAYYNQPHVHRARRRGADVRVLRSGADGLYGHGARWRSAPTARSAARRWVDRRSRHRTRRGSGDVDPPARGGWRSVYVPEVVSRGLVPRLGSYLNSS